MKQMTYTQAATCGENLKVRVTPEQSEKMQLAWLAAGKTWSNGDNLISKNFLEFLYLREDGLRHANCGCEENFISDNAEEIELIDDIEQPCFASQQEVWAWLGQGKNQVKSKKTGDIYGFNGKYGLFDFTDDDLSDITFEDYKNWQKHISPRLIRVNGVEVPAPLESLDGLSVVYVAEAAERDKFIEADADCRLSKNILDYWLKIGLVYATKEDAIKRAEAMIKFEVVE